MPRSAELAAGRGGHHYVQTALIADLTFPGGPQPVASWRDDEGPLPARGARPGAAAAGAAAATRRALPSRPSSAVPRGASTSWLWGPVWPGSPRPAIWSGRPLGRRARGPHRVGGRTLNHPVVVARWSRSAASGSGRARTGSWPEPRSLGIKTFKTYTKGGQILEYGGKLSPLHRADPAAARARRRRLQQVAGQGHPPAEDGPLDTSLDRAGRGRSWTGRRWRRSSWPTEHPRERSFLSTWPPRRCSPPSPATSRCCTRCSTSTPAAGSST